MRVIFPRLRRHEGWERVGSRGRMRHADYSGGGSPDGIWRQPSRPDLPLEIEASAPRRKRQSTRRMMWEEISSVACIARAIQGQCC